MKRAFFPTSGAVAGGVLLLTASAAVAFFTLSTSGTGIAGAQADALPAGGAAPTVATTPAANSNTVGLTFSTSATTTGGQVVTTYTIRRYPTGSGSASAHFTCTPPSGSFTCTESSVPDGSWQYTYAAAISGTSWEGSESTKSASVVVDTNAPTSSITAPAASTAYTSTTWTAACNTSPFNTADRICGTASDPGTSPSGVHDVKVSVQSTSGATNGKYWGGSAFDQSSESKMTASYSAGNWTLAFPATNFPADGTYTVRSYATDNAGNTQSTPASAAFTIDNTGPSVSAPAVSASVTFGSNPTFVDNEAVTFTDTASDAGSGVKSVSYYRCASTVPSCTSSNGTLIGTSTNAGTNYSVTSGAPLATPDGGYKVVAVGTDNLNNVSGPSTATLVSVDTTPPTVSRPTLNGHS